MGTFHIDRLCLWNYYRDCCWDPICAQSIKNDLHEEVMCNISKSAEDTKIAGSVGGVRRDHSRI